MIHIWEEIKSISESPQKCCGFGAYLMFMIDQKTNKRFECDYKHPPIDVKMDSHPDPLLLKLLHLESKLQLQVMVIHPHMLLHMLLVHHMSLLAPILGVVALDLKIGKSLPLQLERCST